MFNMQSTQRGVRWLTLTLVVALAAGGGWAVAAATTSTGVIHACASKTTGVLRLARKCKMTERPVVWNVQGVPGRNGTNGTDGINGTNGTAVAFAHVNKNGSLDGANSKNVTASYDAGTGDYCLTVAVPYTNVVGAISTPNTIGATISIAAHPPSLLCPSGGNLLVYTVVSGSPSEQPFYVNIN